MIDKKQFIGARLKGTSKIHSAGNFATTKFGSHWKSTAKHKENDEKASFRRTGNE